MAAFPPGAAYWQDLIEDAIARPSAALTAHSYGGKSWGSDSRPVLLRCDDGQDWVVKGAQKGRVIVNEQIVGRLGKALGAPVGEVAIVDVPAELIALQPELQHLPPGPAHGSLEIVNCSDREWILHQQLAENRPRFAGLAVLYGWFPAGDQQLIYHNDPPQLVYSVDHGHFFQGGPQWTQASLSTASAAVPHPGLVQDCQLAPSELAEVADRLRAIDDAAIATAIASPPQAWNFPMDDRIAAAHYLAGRRDALVACLDALSP